MDQPYVYDKADYHMESVEDHGLPRSHASHHILVVLRWLIENDLMSEAFRADERVLKRYLAGNASIHDVYDYWDRSLTSDMLSEAGNAFAMHYFDFDRGTYLSDYIHTLRGDLPSELHIPYSEANYSTMKQIIDKQYRRFQREQQGRPTPASFDARADRMRRMFGSNG